MGLIRAIIVTCLCYFAVTRIWFNEKNPLSDDKKVKYEKPIILAAIFLIELIL